MNIFVAVFGLVSSISLIFLLVFRPLTGTQPAQRPELCMDLISIITELADVATARHLGSICMVLRRVSPLPLNRRYSADYINNPDFRLLVNSRRHNPRAHVSLNLGDEFRRYMVDVDFRTLVDSLVEEPHSQVWSDATTVDLDHAQVLDFTPLVRLTFLTHLYLGHTQLADVTILGGLINLTNLYLRDTQVHDITPLARLRSLRFLCLCNTQVRDITPLAELTNLRYLSLFGTVVDVRALHKLRSLRIYQ